MVTVKKKKKNSGYQRLGEAEENGQRPEVSRAVTLLSV